MPVLITALVAIGIQAAALFSRRVRRAPNAPQGAIGGAGGLADPATWTDSLPPVLPGTAPVTVEQAMDGISLVNERWLAATAPMTAPRT